MALPKRKISKSKRGKRRTHQKLVAPNVVKCPQCGDPKLSHNMCPGCGTYKGRTVNDVEE